MTFLNRHRSRIRPVGPFAPSSLFFGGIPGAWYDPTDLSTMFQDSTGTTPVTAVEQPVGLILDKSQGAPTLGPDLVVNGDFSSSAGWTIGAGWSIGSGVATGVAASTDLYRAATVFTPGQWYQIKVSVLTVTAGSFRVWAGGTFGSAISAPGTYTYYTVWSTNAYFSILGSGFSGTIDYIEIRALPGNHASQSTAASRPTYRARYNLLTFSEQFNNGAQWIPSNVAVTADSTTAPDGTTTADTITRNGPIGNEAMVRAPVTMTAGVTYTLSVYAKQGSAGSLVYLRNLGVDAGLPSGLVTFALDGTNTITAGASYSGAGQTSITSVGNGWYRCTIRGTTPSPLPFNLIDVGCSTTAGNVSGSVGAFVYIWGAQLLTAADVTATGNAYQRIAAATVYDTAPIFRPYLAFDGMDDSLSTAVIPGMSSIDKATFFGGATKLTDGAYPVIFEYGVRGIVGSIGLYASPGTARYSFILEGSTIGSYDPQTYAAPITSVLTGSFDIGGATLADEIKPRINGVLNQTNGSGSSGTGNFGAYSLFIGRRNNASLPFNGRIYEFIFRGAASSVTEIADTELWVNARTGAY